MRTAIFAVNEIGERLAEKLSALPGSVIYAPGHVKAEGLKRLVKKEFHNAQGIIFVSAIGIAVRAIAPYVRDKSKDPAIVVIDIKGTYAISLLSGHLGGANSLAKKAARLIKAKPIITTATELFALPSAEDFASKTNSAIENPGRIKHINSAILRREKVLILCPDAKRLRGLREKFKKFDFFVFRRDYSGPSLPTIYISSNVIAPVGALILRPKELVIGVGCGKGVGANAIERNLRKTLDEQGLSPLSIRNFATIEMKKNEAGLLNLSKKLNIGIESFSARELRKTAVSARGSEFVMKAAGAPAVCEPSALLSAGAKKLLTEKRCEGRTTLAIAKAKSR